LKFFGSKSLIRIVKSPSLMGLVNARLGDQVVEQLAGRLRRVAQRLDVDEYLVVEQLGQRLLELGLGPGPSTCARTARAS